MEDKRILQLLLRRAEDAIDALAGRYGSGLYALAHNILADRRDAEESVNDTYLALWNAIPPSQPDPLAPYVYKVGRNQALKRHRSNTALQRCSSYDLSLEELAGALGEDTAQQTLQARELARAMNAFLDTQSPLSRVIFLRRYWFGDEVKTIARLLKLQPGTVSARLSRCRAALAHYLTKEGYL